MAPLGIGTGMLARWAVLLISFVMAAPATAEEMSLEQTRRFVMGKLFAVSCFDGTRAVGRIYGDGSVVGSIQFRGTGPERPAWLPAGTLKVKGEAVCASLKGMPFEPCFKLNRTSDHSFRGSVLGLDFAYCDFTRRFGWRKEILPSSTRPICLIGADGGHSHAASFFLGRPLLPDQLVTAFC